MALTEEEKREQRRISNRKYYLKRIKGDIKYFKVSNIYDDLILDFLKLQKEFKKSAVVDKIFDDSDNDSEQ
jgi:uncharacterized protein YnzC (UPF0291/DUF896 family)